MLVYQRVHRHCSTFLRVVSDDFVVATLSLRAWLNFGDSEGVTRYFCHGFCDAFFAVISPRVKTIGKTMLKWAKPWKNPWKNPVSVCLCVFCIFGKLGYCDHGLGVEATVELPLLEPSAIRCRVLLWFFMIC